MALSEQFRFTLAEAFVEMEGTGVSPRRYQPFMHRLLWWLGYEVPPPHYCSFIYNLVFTAFWFTVLWGALMGLTYWSRDPLPVSAAVLAASMAGLPFGLGMALYYRHGASRYRLSTWHQLQERAHAPDDDLTE